MIIIVEFLNIDIFGNQFSQNIFCDDENLVVFLCNTNIYYIGTSLDIHDYKNMVFSIVNYYWLKNMEFLKD